MTKEVVFYHFLTTPGHPPIMGKEFCRTMERVIHNVAIFPTAEFPARESDRKLRPWIMDGQWTLYRGEMKIDFEFRQVVSWRYEDLPRLWVASRNGPDYAEALAARMWDGATYYSSRAHGILDRRGYVNTNPRLIY